MFSSLPVTDVTASIAVFVVVFTIIYLLVNRPRRQSGDRKLPPSLPALPVVGSLPYLIGCKDVCEYFRNTADKLGNVFSLYAGSRYIVVLNGKQAIHEALVTRGTQFADRHSTYNQPSYNPERLGLVFRPYDAAFKHYQQLTLSILKQFGFGTRLMASRIQTEVEALVDELRATGGQPVDPNVAFTLSVSNVIMDVLFGRRFDPKKEPRYVQHLLDAHTVLSGTRFECEIFPILRWLPHYRRVTAKLEVARGRMREYLLNNVLLETIESKDRPNCYVSSFIEQEGSNFSLKELAFIIGDLSTAGLETTSNTLLWAIILLTNRPAVQRRLQAELDAVIGRDRAPCLDDRKSLPYTEAVIAEVMRFRTLAPLAVPHKTLVDTEVSGYFIPAESIVLVNLQSVHMDPETWKDPECFRPERFLDEAGDIIGAENVISFSLGKRSCLGEQLARQEIFLFVARLLQQFEFLPPEGVARLSEEGVSASSITINPRLYTVRAIDRLATKMQ